MITTRAFGELAESKLACNQQRRGRGVVEESL